jgi:polyphosphate:AMP phosphotransferase
MFEAVELGQTLAKNEFKSKEPEYRSRLLDLQRDLRDAGIATLIIVAGVEGAGKGEVVDRLNKWMDARGVLTHAFWDETDEELQRPRYWRFWKRMPMRGDIAIMFGGWYWLPLHRRAHDQITDADLDEESRQINELEHMLHQDGLTIIKLWFHLSHDVHKQRMRKRREVSKHLRGHAGGQTNHIQYETFLAAAERTLRHTDTGSCPWRLIESDDKWFRDSSVAQILMHRMQQRIDDHRTAERRSIEHEQVQPIVDQPLTIVDTIDLNVELEKHMYAERRKDLQRKIQELSWKAFDQRRSTIIVFEGWDAAGKGGAIRRITDPVDARLFQVISVAAPTDEEKSHHYLWRFWRRVPRDGYMTLYDRSWYGRVLVERVEDLARPDEWGRAYQEINTFEEQLTDHGSILIKFWLHISPDEQFNRFKERERTAWKRHKITEEDWRNREKWDKYRHAVNAMVAHTSTSDAPWTLVPANDKYFARIEVLKTICERLESELD